MLFDLPTYTNPETDGYSQPRDLTNRYNADLSLDTPISVATLYGAPLKLAPPLLVHAALLSYFARLEKRAVYEGMDEESLPGLGNGVNDHASFTFRLPTLKDSRVYDTDFYR